MHRVAVLALENVYPFELGIPARIFGAARGPSGQRLYDVVTCSLDGGPVATSEDFVVAVRHDVEVLRTADTLVIPPTTWNCDDDLGAVPHEVFGLLRPGARVVSICTAAVVLAAAGLLDGRPATTHWQEAERCRTLFPQVHWDADVLLVDDGDVLTSAGVAAGVDLCMHIVRRDHGAAIANRVARECVVPPWRGGGQAQFIARPVPDPPDSSTAATRAWSLERLDQPLALADLAEHARMSTRTFRRRFQQEVGLSPGAWLTGQRVELARQLLESSDLPIDHVAVRAGFGSAASLRQHVAAAVGVSPVAYRRTFRSAAAPGRPVSP